MSVFVFCIYVLYLYVNAWIWPLGWLVGPEEATRGIEEVS